MGGNIYMNSGGVLHDFALCDVRDKLYRVSPAETLVDGLPPACSSGPVFIYFLANFSY